MVGCLLMAVSVKLQAPFWPVPMTMQTFMALGIGAAYGARLAGVTLAAYLVQGTIGLPVFAAGGRLAYLAGPTSGYLVGFLAAAVLVGWLADRGSCRTRLSALGAFSLGTLVIFALRAGWSAMLLGPRVALFSEVVPFVTSELVKVALAVPVFPLVWKRAAG